MIYGSRDVLVELQSNLKTAVTLHTWNDRSFWTIMKRYADSDLIYDSDYEYPKFCRKFNRGALALSSICNEIMNNVVAMSLIEPSDFYQNTWVNLNEEAGLNGGVIPELQSPPQQSNNAYPRKVITAADLKEADIRINDLATLDGDIKFSTKTRTNNQAVSTVKLLAELFGKFSTKRFGYCWSAVNTTDPVALGYSGGVALVYRRANDRKYIQQPGECSVGGFAISLTFGPPDSGDYLIYMALSMMPYSYYHQCTELSNPAVLAFRTRGASAKPTPQDPRIIKESGEADLFNSFAGVFDFHAIPNDTDEIAPANFKQLPGDMIEFEKLPTGGYGSVVLYSSIDSNLRVKVPISSQTTQAYGGYVIIPTTNLPAEPMPDADYMRYVYNVLKGAPWKVLGHNVSTGQPGHVGLIKTPSLTYYCPMMILATHSDYLRESLPPEEMSHLDSRANSVTRTTIRVFFQSGVSFRKVWHAYGPWESA